MVKEDGVIDISIDTSNFLGAMDKFIHVSQEIITRALRVVARELLKDARLYVPVLTGRLRDSGHVKEMPTINDAEKTMAVVYGNPQITYAWLQHEVPFRHPSLGFYGPAKYLEKPLIANAQFYMALFTAEVRIALEREY